MIEGRTIKFGYGDVLVGCDINTMSMVFTSIETKRQMGEKFRLSQTDDMVNTIRIPLNTYDDLCKFMDEMIGIDLEKSLTLTFTFDGYTLDFTKYERASINVIMTKLSYLLYNALLSITSSQSNN